MHRWLHWLATPQANEQEAAITLPDFSASKVDDINLSNPGSSIKLFTLSNATLPEGYTLGNVRVELSTEKGKAGELESNTDGMIDSLTIQKLVVETYGKRPIARPFIAQVYANAIKDGQALLVNAGSFDVNFTPAAPFIDLFRGNLTSVQIFFNNISNQYFIFYN